jgi:hypothetical protein
MALFELYRRVGAVTCWCDGVWRHWTALRFHQSGFHRKVHMTRTSECSLCWRSSMTVPDSVMTSTRRSCFDPFTCEHPVRTVACLMNPRPVFQCYPCMSRVDENGPMVASRHGCSIPIVCVCMLVCVCVCVCVRVCDTCALGRIQNTASRPRANATASVTSRSGLLHRPVDTPGAACLQRTTKLY